LKCLSVDLLGLPLDIIAENNHRGCNVGSGDELNAVLGYVTVTVAPLQGKSHFMNTITIEPYHQILARLVADTVKTLEFEMNSQLITPTLRKIAIYKRKHIFLV
jgi:hypothetical protein